MAKRGSSYRVTKRIETDTLLKAYTTNKTISSGGTVSSATAFAVAGWQKAKLETLVTPISAAGDMKGNVVFTFGASLDGSSYDDSLVAGAIVSNAYKTVTMVVSAGSATYAMRRVTSCGVAGLSSIKLISAVHAGTGALSINAHLVRAR